MVLQSQLPPCLFILINTTVCLSNLTVLSWSCLIVTENCKEQPLEMSSSSSFLLQLCRHIFHSFINVRKVMLFFVTNTHMFKDYHLKMKTFEQKKKRCIQFTTRGIFHKKLPLIIANLDHLNKTEKPNSCSLTVSATM